MNSFPTLQSGFSVAAVLPFLEKPGDQLVAIIYVSLICCILIFQDPGFASFWWMITIAYNGCCLVAMWKQLFDFVSYLITLVGGIVLNVLVLVLTLDQAVHSENWLIQRCCLSSTLFYGGIAVLCFKKYILEWVMDIPPPPPPRRRQRLEKIIVEQEGAVVQQTACITGSPKAAVC